MKRLIFERAFGRLRLMLPALMLLLAPWSVGDVRTGPALGLATDRALAVDLPSPKQAGPERPLVVMLTVRWADVERQSGVYDWSAVEPQALQLARAGHQVAVRLIGPHPLHAPEGALPGVEHGRSLEAWLAFVRSAVRELEGSVSIYQIWDRIAGAGFDPATYAFLLKNSALAARAEARAQGLAIHVAQAAMSASSPEVQQALWEQDVAAYIDILPVRLTPDRQAMAGLRDVLAQTLLHPPAAAVWAFVDADDAPQAGDRCGLAVEALAFGAVRTVVELAGSRQERAAQAQWTEGTHRLLAGGYAPAPLGDLRIEDPAGTSIPGASALGRFFSDTDFSTLIFYRAPGATSESLDDRLIVDTSLVRNSRVIDPATGDVRLSSSSAGPGGRGRVIRIARSELPLTVRFEKVVGDVELPPEEIETTGTRELTAQEIIARYQQVQKVQDDRLERWIARGRIEFHFKLAQGGASVDVAIDSNYFWERGGELEWEQTEYYINGNKVRWKKIPELPLIQPEKVITLPLDLTLDKTYVYRLLGRERVGEREAYLLEFQPSDTDAPLNLYRGRLWIDAETFVRLKAALIQTTLEAPVLSNEEIDHYAPEPGPDGQTFWMMDNIDGQQTWTAGGRTFVVQRQVKFERFEINPSAEEFEGRREVAYSSQNQMLRDTDQGFRYLERLEDGTRQVKEGVDTSQLFAAAGAFRDSSSDGVTPLGGVNYFNYNLWQKKIQMNVFFAGVLGFFTASKTGLGGTDIDATLDATGRAIKFDNSVYLGNDELLGERIRTLNQAAALRFGIPAGQFFRFNLIAGLAHQDYFSDEDATQLLDDFNTATKASSLRFILPRSHLLSSASLEAEFNRRGYTATVQGRWSRRSEWEVWGLFNDASGVFVRCDPAVTACVAVPPPPVQTEFATWTATLFKEWFLPKFQKIRGGVDYLGGTDLDRFSRYSFSFFGNDRLNGFSGSGVRFDEGLIARAGYSFNLFEVIRLDAALESARVRERGSGIGSQSFSGIGVSGNLVGPWKTVISLNYGYAIASDIADLEGEQEFLLVVLKLF